MQRYISNELTHFVGRKLETEDEQFDLLLKILRDGTLIHRVNMFGFPQIESPGQIYEVWVSPSDKVSENKMFNPSMICFCDIPLADMRLHTQKYSSFGLSFRKLFLVEKGANPVFYISRDLRLSLQGKVYGIGGV